MTSEEGTSGGRDAGTRVLGSYCTRTTVLAWAQVSRASWFMQVFTDPRSYRDQLRDDGELPFASGGADVAWIDARDIAAVAERALLDEGHAGQVYELSGPESLSLSRTAELLSAASGHPVVHREVTIDDTVAGTDGFERQLLRLTFERVQAGVFAGVTDTVGRVAGRPAARWAPSSPTPGRR